VTTNAIEVATIVLALWITTHTVAVEIPVMAKAPKPLSCQLCLSGWACISGALGLIIVGHWRVAVGAYLVATPALAGAIWALSVFTEALYTRLRTFFV
jgi:hypothetical protein